MTYTTLSSIGPVGGRSGRIALSIAFGMALATAAACGPMMSMMHGNVPVPPAEQFGLGPRASQNGLYTVTVEPVEPLRVGGLQVVRIHVADASGAGIDGASIEVDGGMPQHGHGLPTKPRVTRDLGNGRYEIGGVRFNMGGWWEFKLRIASVPGSDSVTFNLSL